MDINLIAPISSLGYGVAGYNVLKNLYKSGYRIGLFPLGEPAWQDDPEAPEIFKNTIENGHFYSPDAPCLRIWHQFELSMFVGQGPRIGWPIFELDTFTDKEKHHLSYLDAIVVCSQWAKDVIEANNIDTPTFVAPLGVDSSIFSSNKQERESRPAWTKDTTVFINVGKWEKRKGHEELLEAFCMAFEDSDNVELWMINDNPFIGSKNLEWKKRYVSSKMGRHIKFFPRLEKQAHMAKVFNHVDAGVFPSHAEGFGLPTLELLACGAHIIATNYSAHTEYLNDKNSLLIDSEGLELAFEPPWFNGQGSWCRFNIDQLVEHMRTVHKKKQEGSLGINEEGLKTAQEFNWMNTIEKLEVALGSFVAV